MRRCLLALSLCFVIGSSFLLCADAEENTRFSDLPENAPYAEAIYWAAERGYINGYSDGRVGTNESVTRAQMVAIFYRAAGSPTVSGTSRFSDVMTDAYYVNAASWAEDNGLMNGYSDGRFGVNDPVTRQQVVTILWRWAGSPDASASDYTDEGAISAFAQTAVDWSRANQIMDGRENGRFAPNDSATRAELVSALYQYKTREDNTLLKLKVKANGQTFTATLLDNPTTRTLLERLPMTISMAELNGNEKYYNMPEALPTNSQRPGNIHAGDLMLFGPDCLVLFYESFSSGHSYTRLGSIDDPSGLAAALGRGSANVTFQVN